MMDYHGSRNWNWNQKCSQYFDFNSVKFSLNDI